GKLGETFTLPYRPVQPETLHIVSEQNGQTEPWERKDDFLSSKKTAAHFVLNATEGTIRFGDGEFGRIPEAGVLVIADEFRYGGGARANDAGPGTIKNPQSVLSGVDKVTNERAAVCRTDEQTIQKLTR